MARSLDEMDNLTKTYYALDKAMVSAHRDENHDYAESTARVLLGYADIPLLIRTRACMVLACAAEEDSLEMAHEAVRIAELGYSRCTNPGEVEKQLVEDARTVLKQTQEMEEAAEEADEEAEDEAEDEAAGTEGAVTEGAGAEGAGAEGAGAEGTGTGQIDVNPEHGAQGEGSSPGATPERDSGPAGMPASLTRDDSEDSMGSGGSGTGAGEGPGSSP